MHTIGKEFGFDYGHRVWTQKLNVEYSLDDKTVCRHLHGHRGTLKVFLQNDKLVNGMVTDFKHLNWFKKFIDDTFDHKMILDINDPAISHIFPLLDLSKLTTNVFGNHTYMTPQFSDYCNEIEAIQEIYEGLVIVDFIPTSENFTKFLFEIARDKMQKIGVTVSGVQFFETPKSESNFNA